MGKYDNSYLSSLTDFYKLLEDECGMTSKEILNEDIFTITKELAMSAGYERYAHVFKTTKCPNGRISMRTKYNKQFDSKLSSKWLLFYSGHTMNFFRSLADLKDYYTDIIYEVFDKFFRYLDFENNHMNSSKQITTYYLKILSTVTGNFRQRVVPSNKVYAQKSHLAYNAVPLPIDDMFQNSSKYSQESRQQLSDICLQFRNDPEAMKIINSSFKNETIIDDAGSLVEGFDQAALERIRDYLNS